MQKEEEIISQTEEYVKNELFKESTGHDWYHTDRVRNLAKRIAHEEKADIFIVEVAALLHDIGDYKLYNGDEKVARHIISKWLSRFQISDQTTNLIIDIIENLSFAKSLNKLEVEINNISLEAKIVSDADRLDALGAVGIARTFAFGGSFKRVIYDPKIKPRENLTSEEYKKNSDSTTINHFYEKLLKLKDKMYTEVGKKIAIERHSYMEQFLIRFYSEWNGEN